VDRLIEISVQTGLDICGEQGEYHTLVLDGPLFKKRVRIGSYSKHVIDSIMYIALEDLQLEGSI
jgi:diphthine-ammonia ligase